MNHTISGRVTHQHTVWCSACSGWYRTNGGSRKIYEAEFKRLGWAKIKGKWHCPECSNRIILNNLVDIALTTHPELCYNAATSSNCIGQQTPEEL
jgi:rubredoxin